MTGSRVGSGAGRMAYRLEKPIEDGGKGGHV